MLTRAHIRIRRRALLAIIPHIILLEIVTGIIATEITLELNSEVEVHVILGEVLDSGLNGKPGLAQRVCADAENNGGPISDVRAIRAPVAGGIYGRAFHVKVVLGGGGFAHPLVVVLGFGAGQWRGGAVFGVQGYSLALSSC